MNEPGLLDVAEGLGLLLSGQSFAARALLGSMLAALLAAIVGHYALIRSPRARRVLHLGPLITAAVAGILSVGDDFLPQLVVATADAGRELEVFGADFGIRTLNTLLLIYAVVVSLLLLRRVVGHLLMAAHVRRATPVEDPAVLAAARRIACKLGIEAPPVLLMSRCPGGAFTTGIRRPIVAIDPQLLEDLDVRELEGLLAHEMAHIARRDVPLNVAAGLMRDTLFFLPPLYPACRWLRNTQEHAADDLASESTGRPGALASSIMKVWEGARRRAGGGGVAASMACATMVPPRVRLAAGGPPIPAGTPGRMLQQARMSGAAREIAERIVRLIERTPLTRRRQRVELAATGLALSVALVATVTLPSMMTTDLLVGQMGRPATSPVEAPAFATFRALSPQPAEVTVLRPPVAQSPVAVCDDCLLLESNANWRQGTVPTVPARAHGWAMEGFIWDDVESTGRGPAARSATALWGVDSESSRLGFFLVSERRP